jgi:deferrochelatase/peroxidase EfeB
METCPFVIRETPPPASISTRIPNPATQTVFDEPVLTIKNIQGSIIPGFNKSHRILLFLQVSREHVHGFKRWLKSQVKFVATADEVLSFSRLFKSTRERRGCEGTVKSTWMNIAFSYDFLQQLNGGANQFTDAAFKEGLARRSESLGDPTEGPFNPRNWLVGGPNNSADVMIIIEADDRADMLGEFARIEESFSGVLDQDGNHVNTGMTAVFIDKGANLPDPLSGHEHFGFLDGVSQPGLRGLLSSDQNDVLTLRQNPNKRDQPDGPTKPSGKNNLIQPAQGKPGQDLLYPGEFIFGYSKQFAEEADDADGLNPHPGPDSLGNPFGSGKVGPDWAKDGAFLVYRRLRQDVGGFHRFLHEVATAHNVTGPDNVSGARLVGSKLVGRWPGGAPVMREPQHENPALGNDDCKNNNFEFQGDGDAVQPGPNDPHACRDDDPVHFSSSKADKNGARCPFSAHIRKAYPRDDVGLVKPPSSNLSLGEPATQTHRLLRRGLPFGPVSPSTPETPIDDDVDRGLQFLAYQTSIENQFEFVIKNWVNEPNFKEPFHAPPDQLPEHQCGGHDPIIGQNGKDRDRIRKFTLTIPDPNDPDKATAVQLSTKKDWVSPTAGGYFTPSLGAIKRKLSE